MQRLASTTPTTREQWRNAAVERWMITVRDWQHSASQITWWLVAACFPTRISTSWHGTLLMEEKGTRLINGKWRSSLWDVKMQRGADVASDHHLVTEKFKTTDKRNNKIWCWQAEGPNSQETLHKASSQKVKPFLRTQKKMRKRLREIRPEVGESG